MGTGRPTPFDSDLAIVGSGGAAFSAAISARRANLRVDLIERGTIGGHQLSLDAAHHLHPPTIASAGLTEARALEQGFDCESRLVYLAEIPRAIVSRTSSGVV